MGNNCNFTVSRRCCTWYWNELCICEYSIHLLQRNRSKYIKTNPLPALIYGLLGWTGSRRVKKIKKKTRQGKYTTQLLQRLPQKHNTTQDPGTTLNGCSPNMAAVIFHNWTVKMRRAFCLAGSSGRRAALLPLRLVPPSSFAYSLRYQLFTPHHNISLHYWVLPYSNNTPACLLLNNTYNKQNKSITMRKMLRKKLLLFMLSYIL